MKNIVFNILLPGLLSDIRVAVVVGGSGASQGVPEGVSGVVGGGGVEVSEVLGGVLADPQVAHRRLHLRAADLRGAA